MEIELSTIISIKTHRSGKFKSYKLQLSTKYAKTNKIRKKVDRCPTIFADEWRFHFAVRIRLQDKPVVRVHGGVEATHGVPADVLWVDEARRVHLEGCQGNN